MKASEITDSMRRAIHRTPNYQCEFNKGLPELRCQAKATVKCGHGWFCDAHGEYAAGHPEPVAASIVPVAVPLEQKPGKAKDWHFVIAGAPVGKPRQTQQDKWKQRPCVMRYRAWADKARAAAPPDLTDNPVGITMKVYLPMPKSWRKPLQDSLRGQPHRHKPDVDNLAKSAMDALFKRDEGVAILLIEKRWDDGLGPRIEITVIAP